MSDSSLDLDLKFLPDWLKEPADKNPYADFAGEVSDRPARRDFDRGSRDSRGRSGGPGRSGGGPRSSGPGGSRGGQSRGSQRPQSRSGERAPGSAPVESITIPKRPPGAPPRPPLARAGQGQRRDSGSRTDSPARTPENAARSPERVVVPMHVEILPEPNGIAVLSKQIKSSHRAYPLYGLGRMFLNKPDRHRVRITSNAPACPLFQAGEDGPVSLNRQAIEREAFRSCQAKYYSEETIQIDPPKGNFTNVARCRFSGVLLGPTNHHGYQPALRRLYESRFSRRMDFNDFLRQIEVVSDPAIVEQWKAQASSVTVFRTTQETEPVEFKTVPEVEAHFRQTYLAKEIRSGRTLEMSGIASRDIADRDIREAVREAWEKERTFPAQIVNQIRPHFTDAGLHIWKHRKRILFVSTVRPVRFNTEARNISGHIADILNIVETVPKCTRAEISNRLLKPHESEENFPKIKAALAADLHWLIQSGHVIEFYDGILDLPLLPKEAAKEAQASEAVQNESELASASAPEPSAEGNADAAVKNAPVDAPSIGSIQEVEAVAASEAPDVTIPEMLATEAEAVSASEAPEAAVSETLATDKEPAAAQDPPVVAPEGDGTAAVI